MGGGSVFILKLGERNGDISSESYSKRGEKKKGGKQKENKLPTKTVSQIQNRI